MARVDLIPALGELRVVDIAPARCERLLLDLLRTGHMKRSSVGQVAKTLSGILAPCVRALGPPANPAAGAWRALNPRTKAKRTATSKPVKALTTDEARRFLNAARQHAPEHHAQFAVLFLAGLRPGEGLALTADRVDFEKGTITVDRQAGHHDIGFTVRVYGASLPPTGSLDVLSGLGHQMDTSAPKDTATNLAEARP